MNNVEDILNELPFEKHNPHTIFNNVIYSKYDCSYCDKAKFLLGIMEVPYAEEKVPTDISKEEFIHKFENDYLITPETFPQIILNKEYIGGYNELLDYYLNYYVNENKDIANSAIEYAVKYIKHIQDEKTKLIDENIVAKQCYKASEDHFVEITTELSKKLNSFEKSWEASQNSLAYVNQSNKIIEAKFNTLLRSPYIKFLIKWKLLPKHLITLD